MAGHGINHNAIAGYNSTEHVVNGVVTRDDIGSINLYAQYDDGAGNPLPRTGQLALNADNTICMLGAGKFSFHDAPQFRMYGVGDCAQLDLGAGGTWERIHLGWSGTQYFIRTYGGGAQGANGDHRDLVLYTGSNTNQLVLSASDGTINMEAGDLTLPAHSIYVGTTAGPRFFHTGSLNGVYTQYGNSSLVVASGGATTPYVFTNNQATNDYFQFNDDILMSYVGGSNSERIQFGDISSYIYSTDSGQLDIIAADQLQLTATLVNVTGAITASGIITAVVGNSTLWSAGYDYSLVGHLPLAGGVMTGDIDLDGNSLILDADGDCRFYEEEDDVIAMDIAGVVAFHFEADFLHAHDGAGVFMPEEIIADPGFDNAGAWTGTAQWSIAGSQADYANAGSSGGSNLNMNPLVPVVAGREYIVTYDLTAISGTTSNGGVRINVGGTAAATYHNPSGGTGSFATVIVATNTTSPYILASNGGGPGGGTLYATIDNFTCRLLPIETSRCGDLVVHRGLVVGTSLVALGAHLQVERLTVNQASGSAVVGQFMTLVGGNATFGDAAQGGSGSITCGNGGTPINSYGPSGGEGGDGGGVTAITGDGGAGYLGAKAGDGGVYRIQLGAKGGGTASTFDGRFIIEDDAAADLFVVGKDGIGFWGVTPITQEVLATGASKVVDDVITALQNVGLVSQT